MRKKLVLLLIWIEYIVSLHSPWKIIGRQCERVENRFQSKFISSIIFLTVSTFPAPRYSAFPNYVVQAQSNIEESSTQIKKLRALEKLPSEINEVNLEARKAESAGDYELAKRLYLEVIESEPRYVFSYAGLSNIYANEGQLQQSLLYLNKAISLLPSVDVLIPLLIEKGTIESNLQSFETALQDLNIAEKLFSNQYNILAIRMSSKWENANYKSIQINKAVIYSRINQWAQAYDLFDQILYNAAEREVSPWILRYVLASLECTSQRLSDSSYILSKPTTDFMERLLIRYPQESECNALATSLAMLRGDKVAAERYWKSLSALDQEKYGDSVFLDKVVNWGPLARRGISLYLQPSP